MREMMDENYQGWKSQKSSRTELLQRYASLEKMINSNIYSLGAKKALQENLEQIKQALAESTQEE